MPRAATYWERILMTSLEVSVCVFKQRFDFPYAGHGTGIVFICIGLYYIGKYILMFQAF